jgi:protein ImuA
MLDPGRLHALRRQVARIETAGTSHTRPERSLHLGIAALDAALVGGLTLGAVHEIAPAAPMHLGAATGFAVALARLAGRRGHKGNLRPRAAEVQNGPNSADGSTPVLWVQQDYAAFEAGRPYGPGLALFGMPMSRLIVLTVRQTRDALWAMEEALKSGAVSAAVMELARNDPDLTASRRLSLAAADGGALGVVLCHHVSECPSAAVTRWAVAAAPGARDAFGGLGAPALALSLIKNRLGPTGSWLLSWDHHECAFTPTPSLGVAPAARDRPDRAPLVRAG